MCSTVSLLHLSLENHKVERVVSDDLDLDFSFDKKTYDEDYLDLKDFSVFFKFKEEKDFSVFKEEFEKYKSSKQKLLSWLGTYKITGIRPREGATFPPQIALQFLEAKADLLLRFQEEIRNKHIYNSFLNYYQHNRPSFDILRRMSYKIDTLDGEKKISLSFAENFRFKPDKGSFSLATLKKEDRDIVKALPGFFIYMADFSQFEFRTFLSLTNSKVDFSSDTIYEDIGRAIGLEDPKISLISNLYSQSEDFRIKKIVDKSNLIDRLRGDSFEHGGFPVFLGDSPKNKKIHTTIQTISYFYYLKKLDKVLNLIRNRRTKFLFPLHDAMIFSIHEDELFLLEKISDILENEVYKIKNYIGKDLKKVERINVR